MQAKCRAGSASSESRNDGAIDSEQRVAAPEPVVEATEEGAAELGAVYWLEVERFMRGLVVANVNADGSVQLRLRPGGRVLLAFGVPELTVEDEGVRCTYPIVNGFLVRRAGGTISFSQEAGPPLALASRITGFFPRFAAPPGRPEWTGALYEGVQRRLHLALSKRYFCALLAGERG